MLVPLHPSIAASTFKASSWMQETIDIRLFRLIHFLVSSVYSELMDYSYAKVDKRVEYQLTLNVKRKNGVVRMIWQLPFCMLDLFYNMYVAV